MANFSIKRPPPKLSLRKIMRDANLDAEIMKAKHVTPGASVVQPLGHAEPSKPAPTKPASNWKTGDKATDSLAKRLLGPRR